MLTLTYTRRLRRDVVETFTIIMVTLYTFLVIFYNLMMATEEDIAKSCLKEGVN